MIQKGIDTLEREKIDAPGSKKIDGIRNFSILNILKNVGHFRDKVVPKETRFERNTAESKLRNEKLDEIKRTEHKQ